MKQVKNKWNKQTYTVLEFKNGMVTLQRKDKSVFTINIKEYRSNYYELEA